MRQLVHYYSDFENFYNWCQINSIEDSKKLLIEINYPSDNRLEITVLLNDLNELFTEAIIIGMQSFASYKNHQVTTIDKSPVISIMEFETSSISSLVLDMDANYVKDAKEDYTIDIMKIESNLQPDTQAIQILSSYNTVHTSSLINNLGQIFSHLKIFGGGATNTSNYSSDTFIFHNNRIYINAVILIFMNGENLDINLFQAFDWKPIGKKKKITKTENFSILTIEDSPALNIYKKYFPNIENNSSVFFQVPLYITKRNVSYSVHIQDMNKISQCLQVAQQLDNGDTVQLSIGNYNDMMNRTEEIYNFLSKTPTQGLWIGTCISYEYGFRIPINYYLANITNNNNIFGYLTSQEYYNEENQFNTYHNQTFVMASITESSSAYIELHEYTGENITPFEIANKNLYSIMHKTANELNRLTENLEIRVNQRTKELKLLNEDLQIRINDAVRKVKRQNTIMTQQARLASMGEILENIAHQWRQPLNTISWVMNDTLIKAQLGNHDEIDIEEVARKANNSIQFLSNTIEDFRRYVDRSDMAQTFNMKATIESTIMLIKETLTKSRTIINLDCPSDITYKGFENDFKHVIMNLLNNARDAFEEKDTLDGEISIRVYHEKDELIIAVRDNAGGIPKPIVNKIFEPYYTTKHKTKGTGLGLYMSKNMIEAANGSIEVVSILNQKTTFIIKLPDEGAEPTPNKSLNGDW
jgi:signal transduction histidine kinase